MKTKAAALRERVLSPFAGRRAGTRLGASAVVAAAYAVLILLAARTHDLPPSDGIADTVSLDLFHGDAPLPMAEPRAETTAEPAPAKPEATPVEQVHPLEDAPADADAASEQDKVLQQVLAAVSNEPVMDEPPNPAPPTDAPPAVAAYQRAARGGKACEITERVQDRLQATPEVHAALARIPRDSRSVANAVMLWNGAWIEPKALGDADALSPLRDAIIDEVRQATGKCQKQDVQGPRFLTLMDDSGTALLVLGNGVWRWSDLVPAETKSWLPWLRFKKT